MIGQEEKRQEPLTLKNLADLKRHIQVGTEIVSTWHNKHPDLVGLRRVVSQVQSNCFYTKVKDQPHHRWSSCNYGQGFRSDFYKASNYRFIGTTVQVLDQRAGDGGVLYEMQVFPQEQKITEQQEENNMNEWDRLRLQAQRYKQDYPSGTRILLLRMGNDPRPVEDNMPKICWMPASAPLQKLLRQTFYPSFFILDSMTFFRKRQSDLSPVSSALSIIFRAFSGSLPSRRVSAFSA